ncbi:MAG TPA: DegT/DnrJ/EryC1/StrS family aminotransferase [Vicinamibacterales bacterium]|jgi:dTDP-4-amino-4,6-dideoxygalactose transaminase
MAGPGFYWMGDEEKREVLDVLESGYLFRYGQLGDPMFKAKTYTLEQEFARQCDVAHCVACASGTSALLMALQAIGLSPGDEVIVPAYTFVATYSAIVFAGGIPVLAEIDDSLTLDPADLERRITPKTRALMPVHMLGNPCDMDAIMDVARRHGLPVIEDACQANGATYHGRRVGSLGALGAFSLNIFKTISSGDGGLLVTDDRELYERAFAFHDQGHTPNRGGVEVGRRNTLGLNFRMNELTAAVALAQVRKSDRLVATLREKKRRFREAVGEVTGMRYRTLPDPEGECATLLTVLFDSAERAANVAARLNTTTVTESGWHVYSNMEHVLAFLREHDRPHARGAYPRTDDLLARAINLSVGVVDRGLGAAFGIDITSTDEEIHRKAATFRDAVAPVQAG